MTIKKYVTDEYHEGQTAYINGLALSSNPYMSQGTGMMFYWMFGWQDAMADDLRSVKETLLLITQPIDMERMQ
jgi:ribosome modulation factor